jgi:hypothetical protein
MPAASLVANAAGREAPCNRRRPEVTELAHRKSNDIDVALPWDREQDGLFVIVEDFRTGDRFSLAAARDQALDVFNHPFAYAARLAR